MELSAPFADMIDKLGEWVRSLVLLIPNFIAALLIVLLAFVVANLVRRAMRRVLDRVSAYGQVNSLFATLTYVAVVGVGIFIALSVLGLSKAVTALLAGVGVLGLALGFAFQDITENFIAGALMAFRRPLEIGDIVEVIDHFGTVEEINLRSTIIQTFQGKHVFIPNSSVIQNPLINYSRTMTLRIDLQCGVAYGDDLEKAEKVALESMRDLAGRDATRDLEVFYEEFGGSSINFVIRFWIHYTKHTDFLKARSDAIKKLKRAFDENGITIPFPITTLDFGVVGGERLDEVLPKRLYGEKGNSR